MADMTDYALYMGFDADLPGIDNNNSNNNIDINDESFYGNGVDTTVAHTSFLSNTKPEANGQGSVESKMTNSMVDNSGIDGLTSFQDPDTIIQRSMKSMGMNGNRAALENMMEENDDDEESSPEVVKSERISMVSESTNASVKQSAKVITTIVPSNTNTNTSANTNVGANKNGNTNTTTTAKVSVNIPVFEEKKPKQKAAINTKSVPTVNNNNNTTNNISDDDRTYDEVLRIIIGSDHSAFYDHDVSRANAPKDVRQIYDSVKMMITSSVKNYPNYAQRLGLIMDAKIISFIVRLILCGMCQIAGDGMDILKHDDVKNGRDHTDIMNYIEEHKAYVDSTVASVVQKMDEEVERLKKLSEPTRGTVDSVIKCFLLSNALTKMAESPSSYRIYYAKKKLVADRTCVITKRILEKGKEAYMVVVDFIQNLKDGGNNRQHSEKIILWINMGPTKETEGTHLAEFLAISYINQFCGIIPSEIYKFMQSKKFDKYTSITIVKNAFIKDGTFASMIAKFLLNFHIVQNMERELMNHSN